MRKFRTSISLIEKASREKWIKQLAFFQLLKSHYNNSCIFNYKSRMDEISAIGQVATKTLYNYLDTLRNKGLIYDHGRNLILRSTREFDKKKTLIFFGPEHTLNDITDFLLAKKLEKEGRRQAYKISIKAAEQNDPFKNMRSVSSFCPSMGYRKIGRILNVSENKAHRLIRNLVKHGILEVEKRKAKLLFKYGCNLKEYAEDYPVHMFSYKGGIYEQEANSYRFLQFPIHTYKITNLS
jgi:hypothetical protein